MISTKTICSRISEDLTKGGYVVNVRLLKRVRNNEERNYVAIDCVDGFGKFFDLEPFNKVRDAHEFIVSQFITEHKSYNDVSNPEIILSSLYPVLTYEKNTKRLQGIWNDFRVEFHYSCGDSVNSITDKYVSKLRLSKEELITTALNNVVNNVKIYNNKSLLEKTLGTDLAELVSNKHAGLNNPDICFLHSDFCSDISGVFLIADIFKFISREKSSDLLAFSLEDNFLIIIPIKALETKFGNRKSSKFKNHIMTLNEIINEQHDKKKPLSNVFIYRRKQNLITTF